MAPAASPWGATAGHDRYFVVCGKKTHQVECDTHNPFRCPPRVLWRDSLASRQRPHAEPSAARHSFNTAAALQPAPQHQQQHTAACAPCSKAAHSAATNCSQLGDTSTKQPASPPRPPSHAALRAQTHAPAHQLSALMQQFHAANCTSTSQCDCTLLAARALTIDSRPPYGEGREPESSN